MYNKSIESGGFVVIYEKMTTGAETIKNIAGDFQQPLGYLAIIAGILLVAVLGAVLTRQHRVVFQTLRAKKRWIYLLLGIYVAVLLQTAFFSREPGSRTGVDLTLFSTWGNTAADHAYFIENILMYLPFGILMPMGVAWMRKGWCCMLAGGLSSVFLETCQYLTQRGYCQLDDVLTNTAGALAGWLLWKLADTIRRRQKYRIKARKI